MADIKMIKYHALPLAKARQLVQKAADDLGEEYDLTSEWHGDTLRFHRSGVEGHMKVTTMIPYAAEIYPVHLRGTGSGTIAASSKFGGILGALAGVFGLFGDLTWSALFIAVPTALSAVMLLRSGIETRGQGLEEIQVSMRARQAGSAP